MSEANEGLKDDVNLLLSGFNQKKERIDRALASQDWSLLFPEATLSHMVRTYSDHCPLLIQCEEGLKVDKRRRPFRFQAMWVIGIMSYNGLSMASKVSLYLLLCSRLLGPVSLTFFGLRGMVGYMAGNLNLLKQSSYRLLTQFEAS